MVMSDVICMLQKHCCVLNKSSITDRQGFHWLVALTVCLLLLLADFGFVWVMRNEFDSGIGFVQAFPWRLIAERAFIAWLFAELLFYVAIKFLARSVNKLTTPAKYKSCPQALVRKILDNLENLKTYDLPKFFSGWFMGARLDEIYHGNFQSFFSWVLFAKTFRYLTKGENEILERTLSHVYDRMSWRPKMGFNEAVRHVGMTVEDISYTHHLLLIYVFVYVKNALTAFVFPFLGFSSRQSNKIHFWYKEGDCTTLEPLVFFHGITTGWGVYIGLIQALATKRTVFLFDFEAIKLFSLSFDLPSPEEYCSSVRRVLRQHSADKVNLVGHSFGTITAAWFIDQYPELVSHVTLIDPVSLLLAHPEVAYNFLYRKPATLVEWLIYYGASQEITICNCLRRNFWWYNNVLWLEDVPSKIGVHVSLAGSDQVSRTATIEEYVRLCNESRQQRKEKSKTEINCSVREGHSHAQILVCQNSLKELSIQVNQEYKSCS